VIVLVAFLIVVVSIILVVGAEVSDNFSFVVADDSLENILIVVSVVVIGANLTVVDKIL
jgi:hypothetical protein